MNVAEAIVALQAIVAADPDRAGCTVNAYTGRTAWGVRTIGPVTGFVFNGGEVYTEAVED